MEQIMEVDFNRKYLEIDGKSEFTELIFGKYYDGPEDGIVFLSTDIGLAFEAIGESRSRLHRSFKVLAVQGIFDELLNSTQDMFKKKDITYDSIYDYCRSEIIEKNNFKKIGVFIGVAPANLDCLAISKVNDAYIEKVVIIEDVIKIFDVCHALIKDARKSGTCNNS
jgi:hypothetical protein